MPHNIDDLSEQQYLQAVFVDSDCGHTSEMTPDDPIVSIVRQCYRDGLTVTQASDRLTAYLNTSQGTD